MSAYDLVICKTLRDNFYTVWKRVEPYARRRKLTEDKNLIQKYTADLAETFNAISKYYARIYLSQNSETQKTIQELYEVNFAKIYRAFQILHVKYTFKNSYFEQVDLSTVEYTDAASENEQSESDTEKETETNSNTEEEIQTEQEANNQAEDQQPPICLVH